MMISLIFNVSEELCVNERVFLLVGVHTHHSANYAARDDDQNDRDPNEGLHCNQIR